MQPLSANAASAAVKLRVGVGQFMVFPPDIGLLAEHTLDRTIATNVPHGSDRGGVGSAASGSTGDVAFETA